MSVLSEREASASAIARRAAFSRAVGRAGFDAVLAFAAGAAWLLLAFVILRWPDLGDWDRGPELAYASGALAAVLIVSGILRAAGSNAFSRLKRSTPWLLALGLVFSVWEAGSAKFGWLPQPFFPPPHAILEVFTEDWPKLVESIVASVKLELLGFALGAAGGFAIGVMLGRSRLFGYWVHPVLRLIGPLPAIAELDQVFNLL
jgi:NitT/TauT family transport system permease protein